MVRDEEREDRLYSNTIWSLANALVNYVPLLESLSAQHLTSLGTPQARFLPHLKFRSPFIVLAAFMRIKLGRILHDDR